eukprot:9578523-Karenia_brevis.AAC.1
MVTMLHDLESALQCLGLKLGLDDQKCGFTSFPFHYFSLDPIPMLGGALKPTTNLTVLKNIFQTNGDNELETQRCIVKGKASWNESKRELVSKGVGLSRRLDILGPLIGSGMGWASETLILDRKTLASLNVAYMSLAVAMNTRKFNGQGTVE